jgi:hypothetical protein
VVSNEGTVVQLQDLQGFETSSAHQVTDPVVCDPFAVREGLERATERERERERETEMWQNEGDQYLFNIPGSEGLDNSVPTTITSDL